MPRVRHAAPQAACTPRQLARVCCSQPGTVIAQAPRRVAERSSRQRAGVVVHAAEAVEGAQTTTELPAWEEDFDLLSTNIKVIADELKKTDMKGCSVYLVGMMGCGKSTLGRMLSNTLSYSFFDSDTMVEKAHDDQSVADIFTEHGQDYFRDCESMVRRASLHACMPPHATHGAWHTARRTRSHTPQPHCHAPTHTTRPKRRC
jgi:hypothetical protein